MKNLVRGFVLGVLSLACSADLASAQARLGPLFGYSVLERTDTSLSHGPLEDAASVGRTWLVGVVFDGRVTQNNVVSLELLWGPYHNDLDRYCVESWPRGCLPAVRLETSHVIIGNIQYARLIGRSAWRPYIGGGFGFKRYAFESEWEGQETRAAFLSTIGVRSPGRRPVRIEVTGLVVPNHPILNEKTQFELQARLVALIF